jgi:predicted N-acetyltransferase YhbS
MAGDALAYTISRFAIVLADAGFAVEDFEHVRKLGAAFAAKGMRASGLGGDAQFHDETGISKHDGKTTYCEGERVTCHEWSENWQEECAGGIHFFITREEAEAY